jgi:hypothetical protein
MSCQSTRSIEARNEMFEIFVQDKNKQKHGEQAQQEGRQMVVDKKDVSYSFGFRMGTQTENWQHYKVGSDYILGETRYQRLAGSGGLERIETVAKKGISQDEHWNDMYETLVGFKQKHGHLKVPEKCSEYPKLGIWVKHWRSKYREYKRTNGQKGKPERMKRLENIGLVHGILTGNNTRRLKYDWDDMCNQLLDFKQKHGHAKVSTKKNNENPRLGTWVKHWRFKYREYKRTNGQKGDPERMKCLESIGLVDDISTGNERRCLESQWHDMYKQLLDFKKKHGHVKVPVKYNENPKLGRWVKNKRFQYRKYKISNGQKADPEWIKQLINIGLVDDIIARKKEDKKTKCADNEVIAPIVVSSMPLTFSSNTQTVTKEMTSSTGMKRKKNDEKADSDFLGSELRGGFWA